GVGLSMLLWHRRPRRCVFGFPIPAMTGVPGKPAFGFLGWDDGDFGDHGDPAFDSRLLQPV
ncbi:MAG TPA: hypothetical protein VGR76_04000, partial [Candidatus Angelobacter sp.]|nr:hypothetical protein [Candidatus Angelobacter sp.]